MDGIKFGTDGWRAVTGKDFNESNVEIVTKAIAKYVLDNFGIDKPIIIGYDPRNMAGTFSLQSAKILEQTGFNVLYSKHIVPTPVIAYQTKLHNACAMMFTASHNPPEYLGIKFIPDYAGPATSEITDEIVKNLGCEIKSLRKGSITEEDFLPDYSRHLEALINFEKIKNLKNTTIIFDGFYSASIGYFDKILDDHGIKFESINMYHDTNFGGSMPDPKPKYLKDLIELVKTRNNAIGLANDGDADRFGVINENGEYVSPNEIIAILLLHLTKNKGLRGPIVKTVGASLLLDKIAEKTGTEIIETAVGFKHVGEAMRKYNPVIGGEESGGLSIQGHIPEKDGLLANLLVLEAMAYENKSLVELQKDLFNLAGCKFYNDRIDKRLNDVNEVKRIIDKYKQLTEIGGYKILKTDCKDGVKLYLDDKTSWILIRPSGTEPLLRIYFESDSEEKIEQLKILTEGKMQYDSSLTAGNALPQKGLALPPLPVCVICGCSDIKIKKAIFSDFIIERVFNGKYISTGLISCPNCGYEYSSYRFSDEEMEKLYNGYRNELYQQQRQKADPWYTPEINELIGKNDTEIKNRLKNLIEILDKNVTGGIKSIKTVLDYGGDKGQFIPQIIPEKYVYEISHAPLAEGVSLINPFETKKNYDLIMCCNVLEHVSDPMKVVTQIKSLMQKNNYLYIELPYDLDKRDILTNLHFLFNRYFSWVNILKYYLKMKSANCRIISEHINFFTPYSINKLLEINGFRIVHSSVKKIDQTWCKSSIISVLAVRDF